MLAAVAPWLCSLLAASIQDPPPAPPAPAAAPRIEWQRTLTDALAVQQATGLPLLVAVNMDGEVFNERFARTTYLDPAFVQSTRGYVCVIASPDRHSPIDYDADGNRVECPRFGGCTCSEHIAIEPELFAKYFDGTRNAPRHVGVSKDGTILFDRFLDQSMQTAIDAIAKHRGDAGKQPPPSDDPAVLFTRRDALARRAIETKWRLGDALQKRALLAAAADATNEPVDLLRAGLRERDAQTFALAALALAKRGGKEAVIDLEDALARVDDAALHDRLVARLAELAPTDPGAARLALHFRKDAPPAAIATPWSNPWAESGFDDGDRAAIERQLDHWEAELKKDATIEEARLGLATAQMALADLLVRDGQSGPELWFTDALTNARKIRGPVLQAEAQGVIAYASWMTGDAEAAGKAVVQAQSAVRSTRRVSPQLAARVLDVALQALASGVFADAEAARMRSQRAEIDRARAMMELLLQRGAARSTALLAGIGLLEFGGLRAEARRRLADLAARTPGDVRVHERWRARLLVDLGAEGLRAAYATWLATATDKPTAEWFAGYASLVAGDQHTRDTRTELAIAAYGEAIDHFTASADANPDYADSAHHHVVQALAGRAELRCARGDAEGAAADLLRANELRPQSLDEADGLQRKPRAIAGRVADALQKAGKTELAAKLKPILP
jgi:hypothetical protein